VFDESETTDQVYGASTVNRRRRSTKAEMVAFRAALHELVRAGAPMTVRHAFYRAVATGLADKTEGAYRQVQRELVKMRRDWWQKQKFDGVFEETILMFKMVMGIDNGMEGWPDRGTDAYVERAKTCIPFDWIADNTRWTRKPTTFASTEAALRNTAETYRRALWHDSDVYVEVWCESDSIAGVIFDVTHEWDVPLQVVRGMSSISYLYSAAQTIAETGKPAYLYYFGDYDKTGMDIDRNVEKDIREFAPDADIEFERVAITPELIEEWNLPTKPSTKHKSFPNTVELEALPPDDLRGLVRESIEQHVDDHQRHLLEVVEDEERAGLQAIADTMGGD
jgi:hypothetical protein